MVRAVRVHSLSGTPTVQYENIRVPLPPEMHVEIRHTAIVGSSYDERAREGHWRGYSAASSSLTYPFTLGLSGVGVITEVGSGLLDYQIGQRVCYATAAEPGSFCEQRVILAKYLVPVPAFLSDEEAASVLFEGLVAWMLLKRVFTVRRGETVLIHEITSGLGSLLAKWAKLLGATVIGTVASEGEVTHAEKIGVDHAILYSNFEKKVLEITGGAGVAAVFHSIGEDSIPGSLGSVAPKGMLVIIGEDPTLSIPEVKKGTSTTVVFPVLQDFIGKRDDLLAATGELFSLIQSHDLSFSVKDKYPLQNAAQALDNLAQHKGLGSFILTPPILDPKDYYTHGS